MADEMISGIDLDHDQEVKYLKMASLTSCRYNQCLAIVTGVCSATSLVCLCIGLATDNWLYASERVSPDDSTVGANATYRNTTMGLWRKCVDDPRKTPRRNCSYTAESFSRTDDDDLGPTDSILISLRWVALFPLGSLLILLVADVMAIIGHWTATRVLNFLSGILSVIGGLVTLVGIIVYVSAVTGEAADNKPKPTAMDEPKFLYRYGPSFFITVASFVGAEVTGVLSVHVYIHRYKQAYHKHRDIQQPTIIDGSIPHPMSVTSLSSTPISPRHHNRQHHHHHQQQHNAVVLPFRRSSTSAAAVGSSSQPGVPNRWSNGHRAVGVRNMSSSATALHGPPSIGGLSVAVSGGCPTDDDCSETYSPLSESCYIAPIHQTGSGCSGNAASTPFANNTSTASHLRQSQQQLLLQQHHFYEQQQADHEMTEYNAFACPPPAYQTANYGAHPPSAGGPAGVPIALTNSAFHGGAGNSGTTLGGASLRPEQQSLLAESFRRTTPV